MRTTMSAVFTSAKIKHMFSFMNRCGEQVIKHMDNAIAQQTETGHPGTLIESLEIEFNPVRVKLVQKTKIYIDVFQMVTFSNWSSKDSSLNTGLMSSPLQPSDWKLTLSKTQTTNSSAWAKASRISQKDFDLSDSCSSLHFLISRR